MLIAYHNNPAEKAAILEQLAMHRAADQLVKGQYWEHGKGCAVGCTIHSNDHMEYEPRFGIPVMLAYLEDSIFEGLPNAEAQQWPERFMSAIEPGADLSRVGWQFLHVLLIDEQVSPGISHSLVRDAVRECAEVILPLTRGEPANLSARSAAESARSAARSARSAAESAESAAWSAWSAVKSAAESAESARSAARSARSARSAARSAAESARSAARSAAWSRMADKLVELIAQAPNA